MVELLETLGRYGAAAVRRARTGAPSGTAGRDIRQRCWRVPQSPPQRPPRAPDGSGSASRAGHDWRGSPSGGCASGPWAARAAGSRNTVPCEKHATRTALVEAKGHFPRYCWQGISQAVTLQGKLFNGFHRCRCSRIYFNCSRPAFDIRQLCQRASKVFSNCG